MSNASVSIKTFAGSEYARLDAQISEIHDDVRRLRLEIDRKLVLRAELMDVRKYWFEVWAGIRDIEGNPVENSPRNAS